MKTMITFLMTTVLMGCGGIEGTKKLGKRSVLTIKDKNNGMSLAENDAKVDGLFFGTFVFSAKSYQNGYWNTLTLGSSDIQEKVCQAPLIKPLSSIAIEFCKDEYEMSVPAPNNLFSVDFLITDIDGLGLVSNETVYVKKESRIWSPQENESVKQLPIQEVVDAVRRMQIVYARKDWFPEPVTITYDGMLAADRIVDSTIPLSERQKNIIYGLGLGLSTRSIMDSRTNTTTTSIINIIPMDLSVLDVTSIRPMSQEIVPDDLSQNTQVTARTQANEQMQTQEQENIRQAQLEEENRLKLEEMNVRYVCPSVGMNTSYVLDGEYCSKDASEPACARESIRDGNLYKWVDASVSGYCRASVTPIVSLSLAETSGAIELPHAQFVMEIDFSNILTSSSKLSGDDSSFAFSSVNGVPLGTSMKVIKQ